MIEVKPEEKINQDSCSSCRFYKQTGLEIDRGHCYKNPPAPIPAGSQAGLQILGAFPPTQANWWCGAHEGKSLNIEQ